MPQEELQTVSTLQKIGYAIVMVFFVYSAIHVNFFTAPEVLDPSIKVISVADWGCKDDYRLAMREVFDRYEKMKPTILISNLSKDDVFKYLGERVADRLREDGGKVLVFDWDSYRRQR